MVLSLWVRGRKRMSVVLGAATVVGGAWACEGDDNPVGVRPPPASGGASAVAVGPSGAGVSSSSGSGGAGGSESLIVDPAAPCDSGVAIDTDDPFEAAAAMGLCTRATEDDAWGLVDARWTMADGSAATSVDAYHLGHGVLRSFGDEVSPREGDRLLVLSSGTARQPGDPDYFTPEGFDKLYTSPSPAGYPKESPACPGVSTGITHDDVALEVVVRAPPDAESLAFDFDFFTYEWPVFVCSPFNDFFFALMTPTPDGLSDPNISFDSEGNLVSVNNALVKVCDCVGGPPCDAPPMMPIVEFDCEDGDDELDGTGFEDHAATSWLTTRAPVVPGQDTSLRFTIYDSGDGFLDSTVVIDNFRWLGDPTTDPITEPQ